MREPWRSHLDPKTKEGRQNVAAFLCIHLGIEFQLVTAFRVLDGFVLLMRTVDRIGGAFGFALALIDLAVELAADRAMPILIRLVPAMRRLDRILRTLRTVLHLVGFLIDLAPDLSDLHPDVILADGRVVGAGC